ncbi:MAG: sulfurtransferase [Polaribacter sp.]|uniref:sulfurtransferase n=1 Tax=Polaribacter sp. TaxID=1920175 RepID=UPI003BB0C715
MNLKISILLLVLFTLGCKKTTIDTDDSDQINYLINANELMTTINKKNIKIIDFRKKEFYDKEHIADAIHVWITDIEDTSYPYNGMMPSTKQLEKLFGSLGISNNDTLIVYDKNGLCEAARFWWILQNYNFKNIKMLQGGIESWKAIQGKVTQEIPEKINTVFAFSEKPSMKYAISKEEVLNAINKKIVLVDTRSFDEFSGKKQKKGASKAGRIPNSIHIDWSEAINFHGNQELKPIETLAEFYAKKLNVTKNDLIILYCHSGVRSAHTTFVLTQLLGYKNVKNYDGSWTEWSYFNDLPFTNDSLKTIN